MKINVDENLLIFNKDKDKKVYEIEAEIQRYLKFQIVAENEDEAFQKYLNHADVEVVDNTISTEIVLSNQDEYDQYHNTKCIGIIKIDEDNDPYVSDEIKKDKPLILTKDMEVK